MGFGYVEVVLGLIGVIGIQTAGEGFQYCNESFRGRASKATVHEKAPSVAEPKKVPFYPTK
jgi:hypothetical protein